MKIRIEIEGEGTHWYADSPEIEGFVVVEDLVIEETILERQPADI